MAAGGVSKLRCGPMHCSLRQLFGDASRVPEVLPGRPEAAMLVHRGRVAVWWAVQLLDLKPGDEILVPAYHCGSEVDPLVHYGLSVRAYDVGDDLTVDVDAVAARVTERTRAVYVIHYFGVAQALSELAGWCRDRAMALIEDCAVALLADGADGPVGQVGDAAVFSFRKTLPVPDGGALVLRDTMDAANADLVPPPPRSNRPALGKLLGASARRRIPGWLDSMVSRGERHGSVPDASAEGVAPLVDDDRFDRRCVSWAMSRVARRIVGSTRNEDVRRRRQANFRRLADTLGNTDDTRPLIRTLPAGACPVVFPVVCNRRNDLYRYLLSMRIAAIPWWAGSHEAIDWTEFPAARRLKQSVVALPVHQMLGDTHMDYVAECVRRFASEHTASKAGADAVASRG